MLNYVWLGLILGAVLIGGFNGLLKETTDEALSMAKFAVMNLALPLAGTMTLWLGMMRLAEKSGMVQVLARGLRPLLTRLFPDVPADHPAMGSMVLNIAANMLGLSNAATPLGLRAMKDLESLNRRPGTATNAMCTFLAINTSSVQLIPMTAIGVLVAANSKAPTSIVGTAFLSTLCAATCAIIAVKVLEKLAWFGSASAEASPAGASVGPSTTASEPVAAAPKSEPLRWWGFLILSVYFVFLGWCFLTLAFPEVLARPVAAEIQNDNGLIRSVKALSLLSIPALLSFFPLYATLRRIKVYEEFVEGAKEGFPVIMRIIPYLVTILVAIGMFRGAGGIALLTKVLTPAMNWFNFPPELLPMALIRPLSGSGSLAVFTDLVKNFGPDHLLSRMAGTIYGSTETTFYVLAVYFGSVNIKRTRHAVPAGLVADLVGVIASVVVCRLIFR